MAGARFVSKPDTLTGYSAFLGEIKQRIAAARASAARAVNRELVRLYWARRPKKVVLAVPGTGSRLATVWRESADLGLNPILATLWRELSPGHGQLILSVSWSHHRLVMGASRRPDGEQPAEVESAARPKGMLIRSGGSCRSFCGNPHRRCGNEVGQLGVGTREQAHAFEHDTLDSADVGRSPRILREQALEFIRDHPFWCPP